jgi:hypothetical protein
MYLLMNLVLFGCQGINEKEAGLVYNVTTDIFQDIHDETVSVDDETIEFALTSGSSWEGDVMITGSRTVEADQIIFPLSLSFVEVYSLENDVTLNGQLSYGMAQVIDLTDGVSYSSTINIDGDLEVTGDAKGLAELLLSMTRSYDSETDQFTTQISGTIDSYDTSEL